MAALKRFALLLFLTVAVGNVVALAQADDPVADPAAMVRLRNVRFTVLTPQLLRMEWAENGIFEDSASLLFINRKLPVPAFNADTTGEWLKLKTDKLALSY